MISRPNEAIFFFEEPILSHRLEVNILSATGSAFGYFFWRMNLIGCPLRNGKHVDRTFAQHYNRNNYSKCCI